MELILWRHADAEAGSDDAQRELTDKGRRQAARMGKWLRNQISQNWQILASPARRAQQTVAALGRPFETRLALDVGATSRAMLRETQWPDGAANVIVVGHQPALGQVASLLLSGVDGNLPFKKGGIWWFSTRIEESEMGIVLKAVISPDVLEKE